MEINQNKNDKEKQSNVLRFPSSFMAPKDSGDFFSGLESQKMRDLISTILEQNDLSEDVNTSINSNPTKTEKTQYNTKSEENIRIEDLPDSFEDYAYQMAFKESLKGETYWQELYHRPRYTTIHPAGIELQNEMEKLEKKTNQLQYLIKKLQHLYKAL